MKALCGFSPGDAVCWNDCQGITLLMFLIVLLFFINCLAPLQSHNESHQFAQNSRRRTKRSIPDLCWWHHQGTDLLCILWIIDALARLTGIRGLMRSCDLREMALFDCGWLFSPKKQKQNTNLIMNVISIFRSLAHTDVIKKNRLRKTPDIIKHMSTSLWMNALSQWHRCTQHEVGYREGTLKFYTYQRTTE